MKTYNDQENFWHKDYSEEYIKKNSSFNSDLLKEGWRKILKNVDSPKSILECGANVGRNIDFLNSEFNDSNISAIEISSDACSILSKKFPNLNLFNGSILDSKFVPNSFDLVFTMGVLIHINPDELLKNLDVIQSYTNKYLVIGEYFNRTPTKLPYQGQEDKLFKRDFGKLILENFKDDFKLVDYGFLWGHIYDSAGFDDITWWVFERI